jgi:hypothetical protein
MIEIDAAFFPLHALALEKHLGPYAVRTHGGGVHDDIGHFLLHVSSRAGHAS